MTRTASADRPWVRNTPSPPSPNSVTSCPVLPRARRGSGGAVAAACSGRGLLIATTPAMMLGVSYSTTEVYHEPDSVLNGTGDDDGIDRGKRLIGGRQGPGPLRDARLLRPQGQAGRPARPLSRSHAETLRKTRYD